ncbi:flavodoxin domain-containing protein [Parendozoicomonas haliclonae]|uniref:NADPH--hemoprotein reductase n=1 Tax=Parendozoicomonas haliclonae TaxID=1960125 RepID=A0A1X7ALQ4_9GAMM|nr:flavodoxin domain-containing protein [Parendozoicomonas haliclonae]SMA48418.1 Sulfite reductase [NADPH] flavoprotein alpha-component [Parendozoicomonas haliclonae]
MDRLKFFLMNLLFRPVYEEGDILVCYASQTGTAKNLAEQAGNIIRSQGMTASVSSLADLKPTDLERFKQVLMLVSTCGEGEIPDNGVAFYDQLQQLPTLNARVALFALGDKAYAKFCEAGHLFHKELINQGASFEEDLVLVDGNPVEPMQVWLQDKLSINSAAATIEETSKELTLELVERKQLGKECGETGEGNIAYRLLFKIHEETAFQYQAGDLLGLIPPGDNRERLYSISSGPSVRENHVELCVGLLSYQQDGQTVYGACSRYLTSDLEPGTQLKAQWKAGGGLTLPATEDPMIMVATGAGIAPMMCLLQERLHRKHTGENWLLFGNRKSSADFYYQDELEAMLEQGQLTHLETAFSRDSEAKVYVQDVLGQQRERLAEWLLDRNAKLYVCGRKDLRDAILGQARQALAERGLSSEDITLKLEAMERDQQICFELF